MFRQYRPWATFIARAIVVIAVPFIAAHLEYFVHQPRILNASLDLALRTAPYGTDHPRVQIVDIDDSSLFRVGGRPWSHRIMAELLDRLYDAGAAVVGFDLTFAGPSADADTADAAPDADQLFAEAIGRMPVVLGFMMTNASGNGVPLKKGRILFAGRGGSNPSLKLYRFPEAIVDLPKLQAMAAGIGFANVLVDDDGVIRRIPLVAELADKPVASFEAEIVRVAQGKPFYLCVGDQFGLDRILVGAVPVRTGEAGDIWLRYTPLRSDRFIHAADVLSGNFDHARVAGQIVLIGVSAESLGDQWPTPLHQKMPGVEIVAQEIEQILAASSLSRPNWSRGAEILFAYAGCLLVVIASCFGAVWLITVTGFLLLGTAAFSWVGFMYYQVVFDWVGPVLAIGFATLAAGILARMRPAAPGVQKS